MIAKVSKEKKQQEEANRKLLEDIQVRGVGTMSLLNYESEHNKLSRMQLIHCISGRGRQGESFEQDQVEVGADSR